MALVKSLSVGEGDMFYIKHGTSNFTMIDCFLAGEGCEISEDDKKRILDELESESEGKAIQRFISTHPDEDHIGGLCDIDSRMPILNFYCVENSATKKEMTEAFKYYKGMRDGQHARYAYAGYKCKWLNDSDETDSEDHGCSGINFKWPITTNEDFCEALKKVKDGEGFNNISPIFTYSIKNGATFMWMGDLETEFIKKIKGSVAWPRNVDVLFAPHHGRESGTVPEDVLKLINPQIIVVGEAPSKNLNYYTNYETITQNSAKDITFDCNEKIDVFSSDENYKYKGKLLVKKESYNKELGHYLGSFSVRNSNEEDE